jgi:hypothetical protein
VASTNKTIERRIISIVSDSTVALLDHLIRAQQQRWRKREAGHHSGQSSLQLLLELVEESPVGALREDVLRRGLDPPIFVEIMTPSPTNTSASAASK